MRVANFCWGLCTAMLVASAAQAGPDEPFGGLDDSPRFMLYVHKEVGTVRHKSAGPSFGFAVDRPIPLTLQRDQSALRAPSARIFDLRVAPFDDGAIMLNGFKLTGRAQQGLGYSGSYGEGAGYMKFDMQTSSFVAAASKRYLGYSFDGPLVQSWKHLAYIAYGKGGGLDHGDSHASIRPDRALRCECMLGIPGSCGRCNSSTGESPPACFHARVGWRPGSGEAGRGTGKGDNRFA